MPKQKPTGRDRQPAADRTGSGGETHQSVAPGGPVLTTQQGVPVRDDQNTLRVGERGPAALEDFHFREKIFHFDHERIPERVVHARGYGAHGFFETYKSLADLTRADIFQRAGERTPAFVRFSTVVGSEGSMDLARDVRGFAVKLYTEEGNWDIVGNNIPVFFIQDAIKFPDLIHSVKPEPDRAFPQAQSAHDNFWDFVSLMPESTHMLLWVMSDRAIPRSFRFMEGFGVHTFRFVNAAGTSKFVKFHWKPKQGLQSVLWDEAVKINGADPDFHRRDLWDAIQQAAYPEWELGIQVFDDAFADRFEFDVLDATKIIPEEVLPVQPIGRLVLDRAVDNFFAETEQVAFCTQNIVPGIDFTNDPLLQGRNFSYLDTQLKRLGSPNFTYLPSTHRSARSPTFNRTATWRWPTRPDASTSNPTREPLAIAGREKTRNGASPRSRRRGRTESGASERRASPTTTARLASSSAASSPSSNSTSSTRSCSSSARYRARPSANARSATSAMSTTSLLGRSPTDSASRRPHRRHRRPLRSIPFLRPRSSASWPTHRPRSPGARSDCSYPTAPTRRLSRHFRARSTPKARTSR